MDSVATFLHRLPELCLFLAIVLGHLIGRIHFKGVGFGAVVGTLLAGIAIGILAKPDLPDLLPGAPSLRGIREVVEAGTRTALDTDLTAERDPGKE